MWPTHNIMWYRFAIYKLGKGSSNEGGSGLGTRTQSSFLIECFDGAAIELSSRSVQSHFLIAISFSRSKKDF